MKDLLEGTYSDFLQSLDLIRVLIAGLVLGLVVGRLVVRNPYHLKRLRPTYWRSVMRKMKRRHWVRLLTIALWVAAASFIASALMGELLVRAEVPVVSPEEYPFTMIERDYPLLVLVAVNVLPIFEEWVFRGIIMDEIIRWRKSKLLAVVASAIIFSSFHLSNPGTYPAFAISLIPASLLLGVCYLYTGLSGSIIAHDLYNTFLVVIGVLS